MRVSGAMKKFYSIGLMNARTNKVVFQLVPNLRIGKAIVPSNSVASPFMTECLRTKAETELIHPSYFALYPYMATAADAPLQVRMFSPQSPQRAQRVLDICRLCLSTIDSRLGLFSAFSAPLRENFCSLLA